MNETPSSTPPASSTPSRTTSARVAASSTTPPRAALWLLRLLIWGEAWEVVAGDLVEEFHSDTVPRLGARRARLWFWRQTFASALACCHLDLASLLPTHTGDGVMPSMLQDLSYGLRMLRKNTGFTLAAVLTLALGIGANTAIFSVVHTFLLRPLPYADSERVAFVLGWNTARDQMRFNVKYADFVDLQDQSDVFDDMAAYRAWRANVTGEGAAERVQGYLMTTNTFDLLGTEPLLGRTFRAADATGEGRLTVLSYPMWQRTFGGNNDVVGRDINLNGEHYTVIGVMPRGFAFPVLNFKGELWVPFTNEQLAAIAQRGSSTSVVAVARLRADIATVSAQAELDTLMQRFAADHPETNVGLGVKIQPIQELLASNSGPALLVVSGAVLLVLLMACANVANLLLARAMTRGRELAVRRALGAGGWRLVRQLLTESLLLSSLGAVAGLGLAHGILRALSLATPDLVARTMPYADELALDRPTLLFALGATVVTAIVFGLLPALQVARSDVLSQLRDAARGTSAARRRLRQSLVTGEVALSLLLLVVTGLLIRSFQNLLAVEPGFEAENVLTLSVTLPSYRYNDPADQIAFFEDTAESLAALPNVKSAAWINVLPFSTADNSTSFVIEGEDEPAPGEAPDARFRVVSPEYLQTLRIPVLQGRGLERFDRADTPPVVLINRLLAEQHFPDGSAVGRRVRVGRDPEAPWSEIVGVISNVQHDSLAGDKQPEIYLALAQAAPSEMTLAVRTTESPTQFAALVRSNIHNIDPLLPVSDIKTLEKRVAESHLAETAAMWMIAIFAGVALVLATVGLYGVITYAVSQGTREIGIRMALGARPANILFNTMRQGLAVIIVGSILGLFAAWGSTRFLASLLYGITPHDPVTFLVAVPILVMVAVGACLLPARRATRTDPVVALRAE